MLWHVVYFYVIRDCLKIQRWKSLEKMEVSLDVFDHVQHNALGTLPHFDGHDSISRPTFFQHGVNMQDFQARHAGPGNTSVEVEIVPRLVSIPTGAQPSGSVHYGYESSYHRYSHTTAKIEGPIGGGGGGGGGGLGGGLGDRRSTATTTEMRRKDWRKKSIDEIWVRKSNKSWLKQCFKFLFCCIFVCRGRRRGEREEEKVDWKRLPLDQILSTHGFNFGGHRWVPKDIESRPFHKYARGNMLTLIGSFVAAIVIIIGVIMAVREAGIDLNAAISGGMLIFAVSLLPVANYLAPILSYFGILWNDTVERGDIVEITPNIGGMASQMNFCQGSLNGSMIGVVVDITPTCVKMLCHKPYSTLMAGGPSSGSGGDRVLDEKGSLVTSSTLMANVAKRKQQQQQGTTGSAASLAANSKSSSSGDVVINVERERDERLYVERDFLKTKMIASVPTPSFAGCIIVRYYAWTPVANLQRVD